ncbi:uncharacterized protein CLUP02_17531 [Colletotrichum lupini]|uniref:Uncharacterized protein n=1 Tax=Colletotrichum lupini TaxID=145971 RepID=A0A9Q8SF07_9PEZI|nr:uncharacterized protein CLUP02_17531 [Colletotrichum lupini]UQC76020.1 hypothetical protein CLUP02_17531 [Colletotrichum lupini]
MVKRDNVRNGYWGSGTAPDSYLEGGKLRSSGPHTPAGTPGDEAMGKKADISTWAAKLHLKAALFSSSYQCKRNEARSPPHRGVTVPTSSHGELRKSNRGTVPARTGCSEQRYTRTAAWARKNSIEQAYWALSLLFEGMIGDSPWRRKRNIVSVWADIFPQISFLPINAGARGSRLCLHSHGVKTGDERRAGTIVPWARWLGRHIAHEDGGTSLGFIKNQATTHFRCLTAPPPRPPTQKLQVRVVGEDKPGPGWGMLISVAWRKESGMAKGHGMRWARRPCRIIHDARPIDTPS